MKTHRKQDEKPDMREGNMMLHDLAPKLSGEDKNMMEYPNNQLEAVSRQPLNKLELGATINTDYYGQGYVVSP
jgi:hypothetical protein